MEKDAFSDMDTTEAFLYELGTKQDQRDYLVWILQQRFGGIYTREVYIATALLIKWYSFPSALLAAKTVHSIDDGYLIPRLNYYAKSYHAVIETEKSKDVAASVAAYTKVVETAELRKKLFTKEDTLFDLLCDGAITKDTYLEGMSDPDKATDIIKGVYNSGAGQKEA